MNLEQSLQIYTRCHAELAAKIDRYDLEPTELSQCLDTLMRLDTKIRGLHFSSGANPTKGTK